MLVRVCVRMAVIVEQAMRSDPDVHWLGMTDLTVMRLGATDLTSLCLFKHLFSQELLPNTITKHLLL